MKKCSTCETEKPKTEFRKRSASKDGCTAACTACLNEMKQLLYWSKPGERAAHIARAAQNKRTRLEADPAYKRAWNLWCSTRRRTTIPSWCSIMDFYEICKRAVRKGAGHELDHIIPLKHQKVCGLHVPWNLKILTTAKNSTKGSKFKTDWE